MVTALALEPAGSADDYALQALERLQEVATFVCYDWQANAKDEEVLRHFCQALEV